MSFPNACFGQQSILTQRNYKSVSSIRMKCFPVEIIRLIVLSHARISLIKVKNHFISVSLYSFLKFSLDSLTLDNIVFTPSAVFSSAR